MYYHVILEVVESSCLTTSTRSRLTESLSSGSHRRERGRADPLREIWETKNISINIPGEQYKSPRSFLNKPSISQNRNILRLSYFGDQLNAYIYMLDVLTQRKRGYWKKGQLDDRESFLFHIFILIVVHRRRSHNNKWMKGRRRTEAEILLVYDVLRRMSAKLPCTVRASDIMNVGGKRSNDTVSLCINVCYRIINAYIHVCVCVCGQLHSIIPTSTRVQQRAPDDPSDPQERGPLCYLPNYQYGGKQMCQKWDVAELLICLYSPHLFPPQRHQLAPPFFRQEGGAARDVAEAFRLLAGSTVSFTFIPVWPPWAQIWSAERDNCTNRHFFFSLGK